MGIFIFEPLILLMQRQNLKRPPIWYWLQLFISIALLIILVLGITFIVSNTLLVTSTNQINSALLNRHVLFSLISNFINDGWIGLVLIILLIISIWVNVLFTKRLALYAKVVFYSIILDIIINSAITMAIASRFLVHIYGISGIAMTLAGIMLALTSYMMAKRFNATFSKFGISLLLLAIAYITVVYKNTILCISIATIGVLLLALSLNKGKAENAKASKPEESTMLLIISDVLLIAVLLFIAFPSSIYIGSTTINIIAHYIGLFLGFLVSFYILKREFEIKVRAK
jgi:hypothetical protein